MSVGGIVVEVIIIKDEQKVYINTTDEGNECAIYVELDDDSKMIKSGDVVWWQGNKAYWTTKDRKSVIERTLSRVGYSGVLRPN